MIETETKQMVRAVTTKKKDTFNKVYVNFFDTVRDMNCVAIRKDHHLNKDAYKNTCKVFDENSKIYRRLYT